MYRNSNTERYMLNLISDKEKVKLLIVACFVWWVSVSKEAMLSVQLPYFTQPKILARHVYGKAMFAIKYLLPFVAINVPHTLSSDCACESGH